MTTKTFDLNYYFTIGSTALFVSNYDYLIIYFGLDNYTMLYHGNFSYNFVSKCKFNENYIFTTLYN